MDDQEAVMGDVLRPYTVRLFWSEEDQEYVAHTIEFGPSVSALDELPARAVAELAVALAAVIETYEESGWELPTSSARSD